MPYNTWYGEYVFIDVLNDLPTTHDWVIGTAYPERLYSSETYYTQFFVMRDDPTVGIPYASNLKVYNESQLKIYDNAYDASILEDSNPSFKFIDKKNL